MNRLVFVGFLFLLAFRAQSQDTTEQVTKFQELAEVRYDKHFDLHYKQQLNLIRRAYPLAVRANEIIDSLEADLQAASGKRAKKKLSKAKKEELKDEFTYLLKDLYKGEGAMLFKLIERETGMTVTEILEKYKGTLYAKSVKATFSLYDHDTSSRFDAEGDDWITELVIQDIENGRIAFDMSLANVTKQDYKDNMKEYRDYRKGLRKRK